MRHVTCGLLLSVCLVGAGGTAVGQTICDTDGVLNAACDGPMADENSIVQITEVAGGAVVTELELPPAFIGLGYRFGADAAIDSDLALVGSPGAFARGEAFLYSARDGNLLGRLEPSAPLSLPGEDNEAFGASVDLQGRFALVGAPNTGGLGGFGRGAAVLFDLGTGLEVQRFEFDPAVFAMGTDVELDGSFANITGFVAAGNFDTPITLRVPIVPEPAACLMVITVAAVHLGRRRTQS